MNKKNSCSTKLNLVWANICLTHTEWRERGGQILRHGATNLTDRATMAALILCQLLSWPHQSWGENGRGRWWEAERGWENASHNHITTTVASFIPFTSNTSYSLWKAFLLSPVLLFFHLLTSAPCLIATKTKTASRSNHTRSQWSHSDN